MNAHSVARPTLIDQRDGSTYPIDDLRWRGSSGGPLSFSPLAGLSRHEIDRDERSIWRYAAALPMHFGDRISMGEGRTPLVSRRFDGLDLHFKLEWFAPTGSFKDRGASVLVTFLRSRGLEHVLEDSSGGGGAAVAAYAAAAGMRATILVPNHVQPAKLTHLRALGAEAIVVPGDRSLAAAEAMRMSDTVFYASHNWHAWFLQGVKTLAYELWEDLGFRAPDNIVLPVGSGSSVLGCALGFAELRRRGEIERVPRLFAVQPTACRPIDAAFRSEAASAPRPTIAEGAAVADPVRLGEVVEAIRGSGGATIAVDEEEIATATLRLARAGFYVEPTCALVAAALPHLRGEGFLDPADTTVLLMSGTGLKATQKIAELLESAAMSSRPPE